MSKWLNKDEYEKFKYERKNDQQKNDTTGMVWPTPKPGTDQKPEVYKIRFLPNKDNNGFYKKYFYHYISSTIMQKSYYIHCPKTENSDAFCPICAISNKLYNSGSKEDKLFASKINKKVKFVSNIFIVDDPFDKERDENFKCNGKVKLYNFPSKVESKLKAQLNDIDDEAIGINIFNPGEEGYDFILKVGKTKPDKYNKTYYNYDLSEFSRKSRPLGTDDEIEEIMNNLFDINEFIKNKNEELSKEDILKIIKDENLDGFIRHELEKYGWITTKENPKQENPKQEEYKSKESTEENENENDYSNNEDILDESDKKLLEELSNF